VTVSPGSSSGRTNVISFHSRSRLPACAALLLALGLTGNLSAQTLEGFLVDERALEGVEGATIALLSSGRTTLSTTLTDSVGSFRFSVPGFGAYFIGAEHVGYGSVATPSFNITGTEADTVTLTFYVSPQAIALHPILVGIPTVVGSEIFEQRRATGEGIFFSPEMIDSIRPTEHVGEIFRHAEDDLLMTWGWGLREKEGYGPIPIIRSFHGDGPDRGGLNYIVDRTPIPDPFYEGVGSAWGVEPLMDLEPPRRSSRDRDLPRMVGGPQGLRRPDIGEHPRDTPQATGHSARRMWRHRDLDEWRLGNAKGRLLELRNRPALSHS
jgi:hypothetical protein